MNQTDVSINCNIWDAILEKNSYQRNTLKLTNITMLKDLLMISNDLLQVFIHIKAILSFHNRL